MKILFVSGKGGVGKSSFAAALALRKAREGHRTLLVELGDTSFYALALGKSVGNTPVPWRDGVDLALWDGPACLREYALHLIKSSALYTLFFENRVSKSLIQVAPGLSELAIIGKITSGPPRHVGPKIPYDVLVIDAYSSGHFLALLNAPLGFAKAIRFGPMAEQTEGILSVLRDPEICEYNFVTLAEALPLQETQELLAKFRESIPVEPKIVLNRWLPVEVTQALAECPAQNLDLFLEDQTRKAHQQKEAEKLFQSQERCILPWILSNRFDESVMQLADRMSFLPAGGVR